MGLGVNFYLRENLRDIACKQDLTKSAFVFSGTIRNVCRESPRKRKDIFQVPISMNEELITSFNKILTIAQYPFTIGMLKHRI